MNHSMAVRELARRVQDMHPVLPQPKTARNYLPLVQLVCSRLWLVS